MAPQGIARPSAGIVPGARKRGGEHRNTNINFSLLYQTKVGLDVVAQTPIPNVANFGVSHPRPGGTRMTTDRSSKALPRPSTLVGQRLPPLPKDTYLLEGFDLRWEPLAVTLLPPASTLGPADVDQSPPCPAPPALTQRPEPHD